MCPFGVETVKIFGASHLGIFDFGCEEVHLSFLSGGGFVGGGLLAVWLGFWDFDTQCLRFCLEVLQTYDAGHRNPVWNSEELRKD